MRIPLLCTLTLVSLCVFPAAWVMGATITPTSGSRAVGVNVINETGGGNGATGALTGRWDSSISITRPVSREGVVIGTMTCHAEQHSNITSQSIVDNGFVQMTRTESEGATVAGIAQSLISIRFTIDQATPYSLQLFQPGIGITFSGTAQVFIFRDSGGSSISGVDVLVPGPATGILQPGAYRLETTMRIFATLPRGGPGEFFHAWSFNIPSPAHAAPLATMFMLVPRRRRC